MGMGVHTCNSTLKRPRKEDRKFRDSLSYIIRPCLKKQSQAPVAYACNFSYLGGWDWEDCSLRPALTNSSGDPICKLTRAK
jgi:hypothetical protein